MSTRSQRLLALAACLALCPLPRSLKGQSPSGSGLPPFSPTQGLPGNTTAPLAAVGTAEDHPGASPHPAQVQCTGGELEIRAENSSLNGILRAISRCTGMRITGGVGEQRVFGNYGPAAPATVIATLIDGTGTNMLLKETATDQPTELILTPRTGGPTPPSPSTYADEAPRDPSAPQDGGPGALPYGQPGQPSALRPNQAPGLQTANPTTVPQSNPGSAVTSPQPIPQPINNVNGSPSNTSPTAATFPTTNSVPLDSLRTPSTTPAADGIVDAPNPPPAGSDTAAALSGAPKGTPGTTNINPAPTSQTSTPGATNTTVPVNGAPAASGQAPAALTPEQIFQQLQQRQQQQQQQPQPPDQNGPQ